MLTLPTKIDWNNLNGIKWTTGLRSQGGANRTCVAFGVLAVLETLLKIHYYSDPALALDLSEGSLWTCGHRWAAKGKPAGECSTWRDDVPVQTTDSWTLSTATEFLKNFGVASGEDNPWPGKCVCAASSPNTKIKNFQIISITGTKDSVGFTEVVKNHLVKNGPCIAEYSLPAPESGTHCIAIVGYDEDQQKIWIKDSLHNENTSLPYSSAFSEIRLIEVYKLRLNINIPGFSGASELSLKMVKTAPTYPGNLAEVDPTLLPNLQSKYNASYNSASGWLSICPENPAVTISLPLQLAVPPGSYDIYVAISGHIYFGAVEIGTLVSEIPVEITLQEQPAPQQLPAPQHLSLSFNAVRKMITANWNAVAQCASYSLIKAYIRVRDYQENSLLIEKHDLAITCENCNVSSEITISEILPQYSGKLCKVEARYDNLGQLSEWSEPVGIALATPYANINRLENGINGIFIEIGFGAAGGVDAQIFDGENQINLNPSDTLMIMAEAVDYPPSIGIDGGEYEGEWLIDPDITTFRPNISRGTIILKISASGLTVGRFYNVKARAKDDHFIGPFAERQIAWQPASQDPTWFSAAPETPNGGRKIP